MYYGRSEPNAVQRRAYFHLVGVDGITPATGEAAGQPQISKNGAAFVNTGDVLHAVSNGLYYIELTTGEVDTYGFLVVRYKSGTTSEFQILLQVLATNPYSPAAGSGSSTFVYTVNAPGPIDGAQVWVTGTNDPNGTIVASGVTNALGQVTFYLDPGTYYAWAQRGGINFSNPTVMVVT